MSAEGVEKPLLARKMCLACSREYQGDVAQCADDGTALIVLDKPDPLIGHVLADKYEILEMIGKGGMGSVYRARHQMMDRLVALKMLHAELAQDDSSVKRFQQEAKAASHLSHPNLITLYDVGITYTRQPYIVMEYLEGVPLLNLIKLDGPMEPKRAVKIFTAVADGLQHAHTQGILHRDLKPSNILLINHQGDPDFVKIVDFGLAKLMPWSGKESQHLTKTGEVFGSPIYMSPEQCMGKALDRTSDIYSFGITLFEALVGKPPFRGKNSIETASQHMQMHPPRFADLRPDLFLPPGLERVVLKCLQKFPEDRFQDMAGLRDALEAGLSDTRVEIPESLLVSTRAIPAITANQISAASSAKFKSEANRKPMTDLRAKANQPRGLSPAIIGSVVGGLLLVGGIGFVLMPTSASTSGTVFYYDNAQGGKLEISDKSGHVKVLQINNFSPNWGKDASNCALGDVVKATFSTALLSDKSTGTLTAVEADGNPNAAIHKAVEQANEFLIDFVAGYVDNAQQRSSDPKLTENFRKLIPGKYIKSPAGYGSFFSRQKDEPDAERPPGYRAVHFFKVAQADEDKVVVLVDGAGFTTSEQHPFWKFVFSVKNGKIKTIESITEAQWVKP